VTAGQETMKLPEPFFVIATQNPIEQEGTYPLPEAQLDRFMFTIKVDYPTADEERQIVAMTTRGDRPDLSKVLTGERIVAWQKLVQKVEVPGFVTDFIVRLVRATRPKDPTAPDVVKRLVDWGAGPRAGQFLAKAGQAFAAMDGRPSVAVDDVKKAAGPVLRHRVSANFQAQAEGKDSDAIVAELLRLVSEPEPAKYVSKKKT
jgi:MoxR-like ATPase